MNVLFTFANKNIELNKNYILCTLLPYNQSEADEFGFCTSFPFTLYYMFYQKNVQIEDRKLKKTKENF